MVVDPIADFLTRMRNAQMARLTQIEVPYSRMKYEIANVMLKNKFLADVKKEESGKFPVLVVTLLPERNLEFKRVSKCGQRIYTNAEDIQKVKNGFGISIVSTSQGVMTGYEAHAKKIGGEVLCEIA